MATPTVKSRIVLSAAIFLAILLLAGSARLSWASPAADLLLFNAHVITLNPAQPTAQALAIRGDRIVWVGTNDEAQKLFPATSRTIDLHGATVLPGIIDAHTHLISLGESLLRLNLKDVATEQEAVERVKRKVASTPPNEWIVGWGWDEGKWASHYPTNKALNEVSPNNSVYLIGLHGYAAWVNQKALQIAGVSKDTRDPENGKILRDEKTGEPAGVFA